MKNEVLKEHIVALLASNLGFNIDLFGALSIWQTEDRRFRVFCITEDKSDPDKSTEFYYTDVDEAVDHFLQLREEKQFGYDFEKWGF